MDNLSCAILTSSLWIEKGQGWLMRVQLSSAHRHSVRFRALPITHSGRLSKIDRLAPESVIAMLRNP
jgi:hypothetical protein